MKTNILDKYQVKILSELKNLSDILDKFYLSGGTALAEYYLQHRLSEDLDFFTEEEIEPENVYILLKSLKKKLKFSSIDFQTSFNRNLFFMHFKDNFVVKLEFTYYPFARLDKSVRVDKLEIDSLLDIATNKAFTIYQNPRTRDFIDLYLILINQPEWTFNSILRKARIKFDVSIDPIQLGTQLQKVNKLIDYPKMLITINDKDWQDFFIKESLKLKDSIFS